MSIEIDNPNQEEDIPYFDDDYLDGLVTLRMVYIPESRSKELIRSVKARVSQKIEDTDFPIIHRPLTKQERTFLKGAVFGAGVVLGAKSTKHYLKKKSS
jgi:hypothetical protein